MLPILVALLFQDSIGWRGGHDDALKLAKEQDRLVLLHFWKPQDAESARLEFETFSAPEVVAASTQFVCVRLNGLQESALLSHYGIESLPITLLLASDGQKLIHVRGLQSAQRMASILNRFAENVPKLRRLQAQLADRSGNAALLRELFEVQRALEVWSAAAQTLEAIGPDDDPAWYHERNIDLALRQASRDPARLAILKRAADSARTLPEAADDVAAAEAALALGEKRLDDAIAAAARARSAFPDSDRRDVFLMVLASAHLQRGKKDEARPLLRELAEKHGAADYGRWAAALLEP